METRLELKGGGRLFLRQEGPRVHLEARRAADGRGLYKVWLTGQGGGRLLLGTLTPEGQELGLKRSISLLELERAGCWPPAGGEALLAFPFSGPERWYCEEQPQQLVRDPALRAAMKGPMLCKKEKEGFLLAAPFRTDCPLPLEPLACLARLERLEGRPHLIWAFDPQGNPRLTGGREPN